MYIPHFIISSIPGHLGYFYTLANMNNDAINICVQTFIWMYVFISLAYIPRRGVGLLSHTVTLFRLLREGQIVFQSG